MSAFTYTSFGYCDLVFISKCVESKPDSDSLFIHFVNQSLLITAPSVLCGSLPSSLLPFSFQRNRKSLFPPPFFFLLSIFYILYIYISKLYIYMSGYLVLVYFFLLNPGILQERYFETETFLCLDWKGAHWVCLSFLFWLLPSLHLPSVSHSCAGCDFSFSPSLLGSEEPPMLLNLDLIYSTNVWAKREQNCLFVS